jgi:hypothetical protein
MRSVQVSKPNGPFEIVERDVPEPGARQVRIKVQACGICHSDSLMKEGLFPGITCHPLSLRFSNRYIDKDPKELEQRIKHKMHKTQERVVTDRLWPEIETLNWVLNEILLSRHEEFYSDP